jgi:DNA polymerase-3 subunit alpha
VRDNESVIIGGMITAKTVKSTKNNKMMAFITLEDLVGTVEVIIFPNDYEKHQRNLNVDQKVYIKGRVSASEDQQAKLVCERIIPFDEIPKEIWIKFDSKADYLKQESELYQMIEQESGSDRIVIFCAKEKAVKRLENRYAVRGDERMLQLLRKTYGDENVKLQQSGLKR